MAGFAAVFVSLNLMLGLVAGGFGEVVERAASDPWGMMLACGVISVVAYVSTSAYAACHHSPAICSRLNIIGVLAEFFCFTVLLVMLLLSMATFPTRALGHPITDIFPWYNDFYLFIPATPLAAIITVECVRRFRCLAANDG